MKERFDRALSILLALIAVVIAISMAKQSFGTRHDVPPAPAAQIGPYFDPDWEELLSAGRPLGSLTSHVKIISFMDLECPACRIYHGILKAVQGRYPDQVVLVFTHYPLARNRHSLPAARAAECAHEQGQFFQLVDLVLNQQDSLGLKSWVAYAQGAGVGDLPRFSECMDRPESPPMIDMGQFAARRFQVLATPTIVINGWRYHALPGERALGRMVDSILQSSK